MKNKERWYVHNLRGEYQYEFKDMDGVIEQVEKFLLEAQSQNKDDVITLQFITGEKEGCLP